MRQFLIICLLLLNGVSVFSQGDVVKIKYKETNFISSNIQIPPQFAQNMPKSFDSQKILYAGDLQALYIVNKEDVVEETNQGFQRFGRRGVQEEIFVDLNEEMKFTFTDLFGKEFLIEDKVSPTPWKLHSGMQRDILGYTCIKATHMQDTTEVTAWFTTQLPYSFGPGGYNGLPGTILALTYGEDRVMLATSVEEKPAVVPPMQKSKKGEAITREKYDKLAEEKRKEMQQMYGGNRQGGQIRIINGN